MGRPQTFDTTEVVRAARAVFWENGYEDASLPTLEAATGLHRSSLYHAFGSKRGLFDAAVSSYLDEVIRPRLRPLLTPQVAPRAVVDYLRGLRDALARPDSPAARSGCLLVNAAGAPIARDRAVADVVAGYRGELHAALRAGIAAHLPGLGPAEHDTRATVVTALVLAAMTLVRIDPAQAGVTLDAAIELLDEEA
jgi:AcrR family transcriptional regulator